MSYVLLKTRFFRLHFCYRQFRFIFKEFDQTGRQIYRIQKNYAKWRPLCRSWSPILVPIESPYPTSYSWLFNTNLHLISHRFQIPSYCRL